MWGKWAENFIFKKYGKKPYFIVDNYLSNDENNIYTVEKLKDLEDDTHIIITCQNLQLRDELEKSVKSVRDDLSVDFVHERYTAEFWNFLQKKRLFQKLEETKLEEKGMIYELASRKSKFFLPYLYIDHIQKGIFLRDDYYESEILNKLFNMFNGKILEKVWAGGVILDIGANIGNHAIYFANEINAPNVVCFEAVPETFRILKKNIKLNCLESRITAYCNGISDRDEKFPPPFYRYENIGGTSIDEAPETWHPIDMKFLFDDELISCHTVDSYNFSNVVLMKIDVEGMEGKVLRGARNTIDLYKPYIMVECWPDQFEKTLNIFRNMNYDYAVLDEKTANYLFYPRI